MPWWCCARYFPEPPQRRENLLESLLESPDGVDELDLVCVFGDDGLQQALACTHLQLSGHDVGHRHAGRLGHGLTIRDGRRWRHYHDHLPLNCASFHSNRLKLCQIMSNSVVFCVKCFCS